VRASVVTAVVALTLAGCGATGGDGDDARSAAAEEPAPGGSAVERCTERFLERAEAEGLQGVTTEELRRYVEVAYCSPFERRGWVYADGTLSIDAHEWLEESGEWECAVATEPGQPAKRVPCEEVEGGDEATVIDCAGLHHVRRAEVREYVEKLRRRHDVRCDDGTPLEQLGAS
jgi:hypothetical protein